MNTASTEPLDIAIIGGGPAGTTCGSLLKKYRPELRVSIYEREKFPRDHVGESQLPQISRVLDEMGCWDDVEGAGFPIKIGATYRWGKSPELWDFEFFPAVQFENAQRPAKYEGQRVWTAFQVDRAIYDDILLRHAESLGCTVREQASVRRVLREADTVTGLELDSGESVTARFYVDASGHSGILRRALEIETEAPTKLQNIAIWDYWQNAEWAVEIGVGATRIQVMSIGWGWLWFIPLGPTRTSIGLVLPAEYYKRTGKTPAQLYSEAIAADERIVELTRRADAEHKLHTTKDWSFLSHRHAGENWLLAGESAGFADPILSAGLTLAHVGAREAAYTLLALMDEELDPAWLKREFESRQMSRIRNHIRFADYWYSANSQFKDLQEFTAEIAAENGLNLAPAEAWAWLAQGGFIDEDQSRGAGGFTIDQLKDIGAYMADVQPPKVLAENNVFRLDVAGAKFRKLASYVNGRISQVPCYSRGSRTLPLVDMFDAVVKILERESAVDRIYAHLKQLVRPFGADEQAIFRFVHRFQETLEAMVSDGWVVAAFDPSVPPPPAPLHLTYCNWNRDEIALEQA